MEWRHGDRNERHVQFAYSARQCNYRYDQPVGRPPRYLRARPRRKRLPGLPDLWADQRGVPGRDGRWNTNSNAYCYCYGDSYRYGYGNSNSDCHCNCDGDCHIYSYPYSYSYSYSYNYGQTFANGKAWTIDKAAANAGAAPVAASTKILIRCDPTDEARQDFTPDAPTAIYNIFCRCLGGMEIEVTDISS